MTYFGKLASSSLTQPVTPVSSAGQEICVKVCVGLSEFLNQSNLQSQPAWSLAGNVEHSDRFEMPPYWAPQELPNSVVQPSKMPVPPPGICRSNWFPFRSPPVLTDWTSITFPLALPDVKVRA